MLIMVNPTSAGGRGMEKWSKIRPALRERLGPFEIVVLSDAAEIPRIIAEGVDRGETRFVAAGGDGTVNLVASALVRGRSERDLRRIRLGAIGLGSSNDFHKPSNEDDRVGGVPVRLDFGRAAAHDVGFVLYRDEGGRMGSRPWLINSSIGTTAEANGFFNRPDALLRFLKKRSTGLAIAYAAIRTLLLGRSRTVSLSVDGQPASMRTISNLGVVKNPHFTGSLCYDSPYEPRSGRFFIHTLGDLSLPRLMLALAALARGRFTGRPGASSRPATRLVVHSNRPFALEGDGEVVFATDATFSVMPRLLPVCAPGGIR